MHYCTNASEGIISIEHMEKAIEALNMAVQSRTPRDTRISQA